VCTQLRQGNHQRLGFADGRPGLRRSGPLWPPCPSGSPRLPRERALLRHERRLARAVLSLGRDNLVRMRHALRLYDGADKSLGELVEQIYQRLQPHLVSSTAFVLGHDGYRPEVRWYRAPLSPYVISNPLPFEPRTLRSTGVLVEAIYAADLHALAPGCRRSRARLG
jgi:hypothetical protein